MTNILSKEFNIIDKEYLNINETEFRARFRERIHHTLETQVYSATNGNQILEETELEVAYNL